MNHAELIDAVSKDGDLSKSLATEFLRELFDITREEIKAGRKLIWPNLGTFTPSQWTGRMTRNPRTGARLWVNTHTRAKFRPSQNLKDAVN